MFPCSLEPLNDPLFCTDGFGLIFSVIAQRKQLLQAQGRQDQARALGVMNGQDSAPPNGGLKFAPKTFLLPRSSHFRELRQLPFSGIIFGKFLQKSKSRLCKIKFPEYKGNVLFVLVK